MLINYSECLGWFYRRHPEKIGDYIKSVSPKQIQCKQWLLKELRRVPRDFKNIQLYGGWYGYPLIDMLDRAYNLETLINIDCDHDAILVNKRFSKEYSIIYSKTKNWLYCYCGTSDKRNLKTN